MCVDFISMPRQAVIDPAKKEDDFAAMEGDNFIFQYFDPDERKEHLVVVQDGKWIFQSTGRDVFKTASSFMYVVLDEGLLGSRLYLFNSTVHSQLNAGAPVRCAGWIKHEPDNSITIDNCSGHYTPSLSLFIYTLKKLTHYMGTSFTIGLAPQTKLDIPDELLKEQFNTLLKTPKFIVSNPPDVRALLDINLPGYAVD